MIMSDTTTYLQTYITRMVSAQSEFQSKEEFKPFLDSLTREIRQDWGLAQLPDIPEVVSQIDTSANIQIASTDMHDKFVVTSKHLCDNIQALQKDIQQELVDLRTTLVQAELTA